jgi:hypothetical protein
LTAALGARSRSGGLCGHTLYWPHCVCRVEGEKHVPDGRSGHISSLQTVRVLKHLAQSRVRKIFTRRNGSLPRLRELRL